MSTLAFWGFSAVFGMAAPKEPAFPPPPPMTQGQTISILQGKSIEVPLRAIGRATSPLKFLIRTPPQHGKLGEIRITGNKTAFVTYTHDEKAGLAADSFTFAVQALDGPVSAAGLITIVVSEEPPAFSVPQAVGFSKVWIGETAEEEIILQNTGGGTLTGKVTALAPWKILGNADYLLGRKEEAKIRVQFEPKEAGDFRDKLTFSHDAKAEVILIGSAETPFTFEPPKKVEMTVTGSDTVRTGKLTVRNMTDRERTLKITVPPRIIAPSAITMQAGQEGDIRLQTADGFVEGLDGSVVVESEGFKQELALRVFAVEPRLKYEPAAGIAFGDIQSDRHYKSALTLTNTGGDAAHLRSTPPKGILILPDPNSEVLKVGETRVFEIAFESGAPGSYQEQIEIVAEGGNSIAIPVTAKIAPPSTVPEKVTPATLTPKETPPLPEMLNANYNGVPAVTDIKTLKTGKYEVEIGWKKPSAKAVSYLLEVRSLKSTGAGPPKIVWTEWREVKYLEENGLAVARIERLHPGQALFFRISSIDESGKHSKPSETIRLSAPAGPKIDWMWLTLILLVTGLAVNYFIRIRKQRHRQAAEDEARLAHIGK